MGGLLAKDVRNLKKCVKLTWSAYIYCTIHMANQFTHDQQREIIESFKLFDKDNDGHLTKEVFFSRKSK